MTNDHQNYSDRAQVRRVKFMDDATIDAFGGVRVSNKYTLFDSQKQYNKAPLFWNESTAGSATITHIPNESAVRLRITTTSGDQAVRQTKRYFRYQPGKSQRIEITGVIGAAKANVRQRMGYFDTNNGIFLEVTSAGVGIVKRSNTSGTPTDTRIEQADWNVDSLDGTGTTRITLDTSKAQIFFIDLEWLGVGRVRCGFVIDGLIFYAHEFLHANNSTTTYMTTANLPIRYEIEALDTASGNTDLLEICSAVHSEGGLEERNLVFSCSHDDTPVNAADGTLTPIISLRGTSVFNSIENRGTIIPTFLDIYSEDAAIHYKLIVNTNSTTGAWVNVNGTHSMAQYNVTMTDFTGGTVIKEGYVAAKAGNPATAIPGQVAGSFSSDLSLNNNLDGNSFDTIMLVAQGIEAASDVYAALTWKELY